MMNDGMLPFEENSYSEEAFEKRMSGMQIQPPKNASRQFSYIILKACAFNPLNRYKSIDEMLYDLEQISQISTQKNYPSTNDNSTQYAGNNNTTNPPYIPHPAPPYIPPNPPTPPTPACSAGGT